MLNFKIKSIISRLVVLILCGVLCINIYANNNIVNNDYCISSNYIDYGKSTFTYKERKSIEPFELYSNLDSLGRCGVAFANICKEVMPTTERESIGMMKPSGWQTPLSKYDFIDGKFLYNRCHLIAFELAGENANEKNLITGTRYMNIYGMRPFESKVATYVKTTGNHCLYRVTPIFEKDDLLCKGVQIEAYSVEDKGKEIDFKVFCPNIQPGVEIDYRTGKNKKKE